MQWWCVPTGEPWTWAWRAYPGVWLVLAALGLVYWRLRTRHGGGRPGWCGVGLGVLWIALDWPVGTLGAGYLLSVHMVQFLLIVLVAPPFLLLSIPEGAYRSWAARGGSALRVATHPVLTLTVFTVMIALTHWPPVVDAWMASQVGNFVLDGLWLATGILFWWPVVAPEPERDWLGDPLKIGYLIGATLLNTGVFIYLTFSELPLYATFELAPPVAGLSSREDQVVAGLLMKMGGAVVLWTAITVLFFRWFVREEAAERQSLVTAE